MSSSITYKNITVSFSDQGQGSVVVLLHGFLENKFMWANLTPHLLKTHRVIAIDLLGHGETGCLGYIHTMEDMAEIVHSVINKLNISLCTIIAHSMGGYVALAYIDKYAKFVSGLCLMNSTAQEDSEERKQNRDRAIYAVKQNFKTFITISITNLFAEQNQKKLLNEITKVKEDALKTPLQGIIAALEGMKIRKDRTQILRNTKIKKMMIIGKEDHILDYDALQEQTKKTDIKVVEFSGGHMSHIENMNELTYNLMHFIENL